MKFGSFNTKQNKTESIKNDNERSNLEKEYQERLYNNQLQNRLIEDELINTKKISYVDALTSIDDIIKKSVHEILKKEKEVKEKKEFKKRCYTCRPRGKIQKHIIGKSICGNFVFHHDMNNRPVILITPISHLIKISDFDKDMLYNMFDAIEVFCGFWKIEDYQVSYSSGSWKNNEHFNMKIKIPDKIATKMRNDHFKLLELQSAFENSDRPNILN